jgi:hypothetical protein
VQTLVDLIDKTHLAIGKEKATETGTTIETTHAVEALTEEVGAITSTDRTATVTSVTASQTTCTAEVVPHDSLYLPAHTWTHATHNRHRIHPLDLLLLTHILRMAVPTPLNRPMLAIMGECRSLHFDRISLTSPQLSCTWCLFGCRFTILPAILPSPCRESILSRSTTTRTICCSSADGDVSTSVRIPRSASSFSGL